MSLSNNKNYLLLVLTFFLPSILIFNNNYDLINSDVLVELLIIPIIFIVVIFFLNYIFTRKNSFFINLSIFLVIANLILNYVIHKNSLISIKIFFFQNFLLILLYFFLFKFVKKLNLNYLNFFFLILIIISFLNFTYFKYQKIKLSNSNQNFEIFKQNKFENLKLKIKPDIYHIIPDGLLNINELEFYKYKNSGNLRDTILSNELKYFDNSLTNYPATFFSLSSTLNGSLLRNDLNFYEKQINETIYNSRLHNLLLDNNYKIFWYKTDWIGSNCNSSKYECMNNHFFESEIFYNYLLLLNFNHSWIDKIIYKIFKYQKNYHLDIFSNDLNKIFQEKKPRYVFGYFNLPHGPYTVDSNCVPTINKRLPSNIGFTKKHYFEQVDCFTKQLKLLSTKIKINNKRPYIIIIQSDTGWSFNPNLIEEGRPHPKFPDRVWPKTYFKNFLAISENFYCINDNQKISNSDLFPVILNCLNDNKIENNNNQKFDVYYSNHPKHGKIYFREDLN